MGVTKLAGWLSVCALIASCASTDMGQRTVGVAPTDKASSEAGIWLMMEEAERKLSRSGARNEDAELNSYVQSLTCELTKEFCDEMRVYILDVPTFNASMAPNGMMIIYSGLLLRADNEAELAFVLGHEFGHYFENHSLEQMAARRNASATGVVLSVAFAAAGVPELADVGYLAGMSSAYAFSREKEVEADRIGLARMGEAGYDPHAALAQVNRHAVQFCYLLPAL